jgi:hypothetical protein
MPERHSRNVVMLYERYPETIGLILMGQTGAFYANQTGGYACWHREIEGTFISLGESPFEFYEFFGGPPWGGYCDNGINAPTADFLDTWLASRLNGVCRVDRTSMSKSAEAWILVTIEPNVHPDLQKFAGKSAVLTWANSD